MLKATQRTLQVMELPDAGKNCSFETCNLLDFLPINCSQCNKIFCKEHASPNGGHSCSAPIDNVVHEQKTIPGFRCTLCKSVSLVELACPVCSKHFCLTHRHHDPCKDTTTVEALSRRDKSRAAREEFRKVKSSTDKQVDERLKNAKNRALANKIKLMKIKGKAVGDQRIPVTERLHFLVAEPLQGCESSRSHALYFSSTWTLGKTIDRIASRLKVPNKNTSPNEPALCLLSSSGGLISNDTSCTLKSLIEVGSLVDGDSLIMEYISPERLENCDSGETLLEPDVLVKYKFV